MFTQNRHLSDEIISILLLLQGGNSSNFAATYFNEIYVLTEQEIAQAVKYFNDEKERLLLQAVRR